MMTEKDFLDVFPQLKVDPELESLLGEVKVMKVSINRRRTVCGFMVLSRQWIHKSIFIIWKRQLKNSFLPMHLCG